MSDYLLDDKMVALERIERDAMLDIWQAVGTEAASSLDIAHESCAGVALTAMRAFDFGLFNRAQGFGCERSMSEVEVADAVAWLRLHCAPAWRMQLVPMAVSDVFVTCASSLGLACKGHGPAKMYRDASPPLVTEFDTNFDVRPVTREHASACFRTCAEGFGIPLPVITALAENLIGRPRWHAYAAYQADQPIAFGLTFVDGKWAWLGWGSTLPSHRGHGAQSAILRRRVVDGLALGVEHFAVECMAPSGEDRASYTSFRNIVRAGFSEAYVRVAYGPA